MPLSAADKIKTIQKNTQARTKKPFMALSRFLTLGKSFAIESPYLYAEHVNIFGKDWSAHDGYTA